MTVTLDRDNNKLTVAIDGRLDTLTAPELEERLEGELDGVDELVFDMEKLNYISSAGLRVILGVLKTMRPKGEMKLKNVIPDVMEIFEVTGMIAALNIE